MSQAPSQDPGAPLLYYRMYLIGDDGGIVKALELHCAGDDDAISAATELAAGAAAELWQRGRLVTQIRPRG